MRKLRAVPRLDASILDLAEQALTYKLEDYGHDRRNQRPTTVEGDRAVSALCGRSGPLSTALLGTIARQKDSSIELPCCNVCTNRYRIDFSARRAMATEELQRRGIASA